MEITGEVVSDQTIAKRKRTKRPRPSSSSSPSSSGDNRNYSSPVSSTTSAEDEDMANCLILLARGGSDAQGKAKPPENKSHGGGRIGIYIYECKTCGRTFPSFQALGGHRASHKKPNRNNSPTAGEEGGSILSDAAAVAPPQLIGKGLNIESKVKIHECSICGSEFGSGQALGGHMRKHRAASNNGNANKSVGDCESSVDEVGGRAGNVAAVDFDLNLPAPEEEEEDHGGADFDGRFQRPRLVFSAAALVGCHY